MILKCKQSIFYKLILFYLFFSEVIFPQNDLLRTHKAFLEGGFGLTWIDGQPHYAFHFSPEIQFFKVGIGLNLNLEFTPSGKIRTENFNEFTDYLSIIDYVKYGNKYDPLYFRIGLLDYATLGHGSIMYLYNNSPSYDAKKIGIEFDMDFNKFGFESVYGNFGQSGVIGLRGYVRPIKFTELSSLPVVSNLEIGITITTDTDDKSGIISGVYDSRENMFIPLVDKGNMTILGFDLGIPLFRMGFFNLDIYYDYSKIIEFGSGSALGTIIDFRNLSLLTLKIKLERRFNGSAYLPSYFNSFYEIERFILDRKNGSIKSKIQKLIDAEEGNGYFGDMMLSVLNTFDILASFQKLDKLPNSGMLYLRALVNPADFPYVFSAGYNKINIINLEDLFRMDDRSYLYAEFGYKIQKYFLLSMIYSWTYTPTRDNIGNIIGFRTQKKFEPKLSFVYPINFGSEN